MNIVTIPDYKPETHYGEWPRNYVMQSAEVVNMLHKVFRGWKGSIDGVECKILWYRLTPTIATLDRDHMGLMFVERNLDGTPISPPRNNKAWMDAQNAEVRHANNITERTALPPLPPGRADSGTFN